MKKELFVTLLVLLNSLMELNNSEMKLDGS